MPLLVLAALVTTSLLPSRLQCEGLVDPVGIDVGRPKLSWIVESPEMGQRQTAYRILVASDRAKLRIGKADLWDSGKVGSDETRDISYSGKPLQPAERVFWNVQVWDKDGSESAPTKAASWTMHMLVDGKRPAPDSQWPPKWIGLVDRTTGSKGTGYHALEDKSLEDTKWVQVDLGQSTPIDQVILDPVRNHLGYPLFGFPVRFKVEASDDPAFASSTLLLDHTSEDFAMTGDPVKIDQPVNARYVRVTATRLFRRKDGIGCFALAEVEVMSNGQNVALGKPATALDSVERDGWTLQALTDGAGIKPDPVIMLLRKDIRVAKPIRRALAFVSGLGQYEMHINGAKVGEDWLTPGWTEYQKSVLVDAYDVTQMLRRGKNALGLIVGNGMYNMEGDSRGSQQPNSDGSDKAMCYLRLELTDGSVQVIRTDGTWRAAPGPETYSGVYGGEDYDARLEPAGWDEPGFDEKTWTPAIEVSTPEAEMHGITHAAPPMRVAEIRTAIKKTEPKPNLLVLDLGQNAPYVPQVEVRGQAGSSIRMWPAEQLHPDGTADQQTMRAGKYATYTLDGKGTETWHPLFWYCGSRYWQIDATDPSGKPIDPGSILRSFKGLMVHGSEKPTGTFECSNELFNQIYSLIRWAMVSNFASVISDCPHREKSGWLEEDHLNGPGLMYCFDMSTMFRKVVDDMADTQQPNGMVPTMAPEYFFYQDGFRDSIEWGGSYLFLPRYMRDWYANFGVIGDHYDGMKRYVDYLGTRAKEGILSNGLGDWNGYGNDPRTPVAITDTAYYYLAAKTLSEFATRLGKTQDAAAYGDLAAQIRASFNRAFFDPTTGKVGTGSQSAQATALDLGLIDPADETKVFEEMLQDVKDHDYAVSCGEVGHPSLLRVLADHGRSDVVAKIHLQTDRPGYGYQIKKGMTTLTEAWDASPISLNHFMLGHLMEWLYADLAGIQPDPTQPGFKAFVIHPRPVPEVTWAKATYDTIRGKILCSWRIENGTFTLDVDVPANCSAKVVLPQGFRKLEVRVRASAETIDVLANDDGSYSLPSGQFTFVSLPTR